MRRQFISSILLLFFATGIYSLPFGRVRQSSDNVTITPTLEEENGKEQAAIRGATAAVSSENCNLENCRENKIIISSSI